VIRYGPAASPRWFNQDPERFNDYAGLLRDCGASAIEFVLLPGTGNEELGRFHLLEGDWEWAFARSHAAGFVVNVHAPLPSEYRMAEWENDRQEYQRRIARVLGGLRLAEEISGQSPVLVVHAAANDPQTSRDALTWMRSELERLNSRARIAVELRAPSISSHGSFDRNLQDLGEFVRDLGDANTGICWDIAHDWEIGGSISVVQTTMLAQIFHVHLHDSHGGHGVHAPLDSGAIPWRSALDQLKIVGWDGSITLEIRYRYASEIGDPWEVLRANLNAIHSSLMEE
jgi:sugar phosphate isomerase/epimerase